MRNPPRRKCADCPALTIATYCRQCVQRHRKPAPLTMPPGASLADLFSGSTESDRRRRAVLDAIDLVALIGGDGWIGFIPWAERSGYEVPTQRDRARRGAAPRQWERLKVRLREHGLHVETRASEDTQHFGEKQTSRAFDQTAMRFTVDGWDRLAALSKALDDWLCAKREETK